MRIAEVALGALAGETKGAVLELRRQAVTAVVRQQRLREELAQARAQAAWIERRAFRALERGEDMLARQVLARGICTLKVRDALEEESAEARRRLAEVLTALVRAENRAWGVRPPSSRGRAGAGVL